MNGKRNTRRTRPCHAKELRKAVRKVEEGSSYQTYINDGNCPVDANEYVQLKLANGHTPIEKAGTFYWGLNGRGDTYPFIEQYRIASEEEFNKYQKRKADARKERAFVTKSK